MSCGGRRSPNRFVGFARLKGFPGPPAVHAIET